MKMLISSFFSLPLHKHQRGVVTQQLAQGDVMKTLKEENIIKSVTSQSIFFPLTLCFVCILQ